MVTIKDIAKALNLSPSTVSRALRGSYEINPQTKQLVLDYAAKMHYYPNPIALSLKGSKSKAIGVIVPEIAHSYFSQVINGIEEVAYKRGYHVVIFQSLESYEREVISIENMMARRVDGVLISISSYTIDFAHLQKLRDNQFPVVLFDRITDEIDTFKVVADNFAGAFAATEHLISTGRRRIAHITSLPWLSITQERLEGYKSALAKYDIAFDESLVKYCSFDAGEITMAIKSLLALTDSPDAFLSMADRLTLSCLTNLKEMGINIPTDISLVGFSNLTVAHLLDPPFSTVVQPAFETGQTAAQLLLDWIEKKDKNVDFNTKKLPMKLLIRKSSQL